MPIRKGKKKKPLAFFFFLFITIAVLIVVLLEYLDFKSGKESFIFTKLVSLKTVSDRIDHFNSEFLITLNNKKIAYDYFKDDKNIYHFKLSISPSKFEELFSNIKSLTAKLKAELKLSEVQKFTDKTIMLYRLKFGEKASHLILITKQKKEKIEKRKIEKKVDKTPKIAFIIDDLGNRNTVSLELKKLNIPITGSILPLTPFAEEEARKLHSYGLEMMIHLPMQPKNSFSRFPRNRYITVESTNNEISGMIKNAKAKIPYAKGANNHMGSLITSRKNIITRVLKIAKKEGLFFVDSRTSVDTVAYETARNLGIRSIYRDKFLDDSDYNHSYTHSIKQIRELVKIAIQKGKAVAIGHPFESTFQAIKDSVKYIRSRGIKIVFVSEILD